MYNVGLGSIKIPINKKQYFTVFGGPYLDKPGQMVGVKMAKEIKASCQVAIPTQDFSVPSFQLLDGGLERAVSYMLAGDPLYVGCMGGKGRTGLFLAILAKAVGIENPVEYVREHYYPKAVENALQYRFVLSYEIPNSVKRQLKIAKYTNRLFFWKKNLTNLPESIEEIRPSSEEDFTYE